MQQKHIWLHAFNPLRAVSHTNLNLSSNFRAALQHCSLFPIECPQQNCTIP